MREINFRNEFRGIYSIEGDTEFGKDDQLKLIIFFYHISDKNKPEQTAERPGYIVIVSKNGEALFYDNENNLIAQAEKTDRQYSEVRVFRRNEFIEIGFGAVETIDNYPHCDGEYDRWDTVWVTSRSVKISLADNSITIQ